MEICYTKLGAEMAKRKNERKTQLTTSLTS